jgi:hypothetical protein
VPYTQQNLTWTQHGFDEKIGEIQKVAKEADIQYMLIHCMFFSPLIPFLGSVF